MFTLTEYLDNRLLMEFVDPKEQNGKFTDKEHQKATDALNALPLVPTDQIFFKNPDKEEVFLTDVGFGDHGRVYHIPEEDKDKLTRVRISLEGIGKGQPTCQKEGIQRAIDIAHEKDTDKEEKVPIMVKENGTYYTQDGHHRTSAHLLAGRKNLVVDMILKKGDKFYSPAKTEERIDK